MAVIPFKVKPGALRLADLRRPLYRPAPLAFSAGARKAVERANRTVEDILAKGQVVYGVNTGFGILAQTRIADEDLQQLQRNLVLSHAAGTGAALDDGVVRLVCVLKTASLALGYSGVRWRVIEALSDLLRHDILPLIPAKGSVGASGDLAPLAHLSAALIGEGQVRVGGRTMSAARALKRNGLKALTLRPKEGLALINGTQVSTALALKALYSIEALLAAAVVGGALSVDAARGTDVPFDPRIQAIRGQQGQIDVAAVYRKLIRGSAIRRSHADCDRVQDPYSLRCQPQVMGACLDQIRHVARILAAEANAVSDNPLVFAADGDVLSGGNFHGEPVAMAADVLALAMAEIGALAERRIALLIDPNFSHLPPFLVADSGLNSGFMVAQVTAAALASENKSLAHPACVDSLPTSANQEDHVSMATFAARRLLEMADNVAGILAIELLAAAQGIELLAPLATSKRLSRALQLIRSKASHYGRDRFFAPDIAAIKAEILSGRFLPFMPKALLPSGLATPFHEP